MNFFYSFIEQREVIHQGELEIHWYVHQRGGYLEMGASLEIQDDILSDDILSSWIVGN